MARSKEKNILKSRIFRKRIKDLRTSFKYILNLESRDTYSDPGTGFQISKHSIAPKTGIRALSSLLLSKILKSTPPKHFPNDSTSSLAAHPTNDVTSPKTQILSSTNSSNQESLNPSSHHMVQVEIPRDDFNFETPSGEPSRSWLEPICSPLVSFREFIRALTNLENPHLNPCLR